MAGPENAPRPGNPVLSKQQLERLFRAAVVAYGADLNEARTEAVIKWAEEVMVNAELLGRIVNGGDVVLRMHQGDWVFREATPAEQEYILDATGKGVKREGEADGPSTDAVRPGPGGVSPQGGRPRPRPRLILPGGGRVGRRG